MKLNAAILLLVAMSGGAGVASAADQQGTQFEHKDWQLACDNTGTCRAAGYQEDGVQPAVSMLLVRSAGAHQALTGQIRLGSYDESDSAMADGVAELAIKVNGRAVGKAVFDGSADAYMLPRSVMPALLAALQQSSSVTFWSGNKAWKLSSAGASAVLLKMDDVQGRLGTVGAIVRKGSKREESVVPPTAPPLVVAAPVSPASGQAVLNAAQRSALWKALQRVTSADDCAALHGGGAGGQAAELDVQRLSGTRLIASMVCQTGAYNQSSTFWLVNAAPPYAPVVAVDHASDYADGEISSSQKGRGLGDCWTADTWIWDGVRFVPTLHATTGMCRLVAAGGAWHLPSYVATVRKAAAKAR